MCARAEPSRTSAHGSPAAGLAAGVSSLLRANPEPNRLVPRDQMQKQIARDIRHIFISKSKEVQKEPSSLASVPRGAAPPSQGVSVT